MRRFIVLAKASFVLAFSFFASARLLAQNHNEATNGLKEPTNTSVGLGGTLTEDTKIDLGSTFWFKLSKNTQDYLTVLNGGNVGIGLSSPAYLLDVNGAVRIGSLTTDPTGANGVLYYNSSTNKLKAYSGGAWKDVLMQGDVSSGGIYPDKQIVYGTGAGSSSSSNFIYNAANGSLGVLGTFASVQVGTNSINANGNDMSFSSPNFNYFFGTLHAGTDARLQTNGLFRIQSTGLKIDALSTPIGTTKMVVTNQDGLLSYQDIPGGTGSLPSNQIAYGTGSGVSGSPNFTFDGTNNILKLDAVGTYSGNGLAFNPGVEDVYGNIAFYFRPTNLTANGARILRVDGRDGGELFSVNTLGQVVTKGFTNIDGDYNTAKFTFLDYTHRIVDFTRNCSDDNPGVGPLWRFSSFNSASRDVIHFTNGSGLAAITGQGSLRLSGLAAPVGTTKMVTTDQNGLLSYQDIPSGSGGTVSVTSNQVAFGGVGNIITSNNNLTYDGSTFAINTSGVTADYSQYKLAVNGNAIFTRVKVRESNAWPDYVFSHSYNLPSLKEVESFIKQYNHLPEVPSAEEVKKEGIDIGDTQAMLLKKIEELTLYAIDQQKEIEILKEQNKSLGVKLEQVNKLAHEIESIKSLLKK